LGVQRIADSQKAGNMMSGGNEKGAEEVAPFGEEGDNGKN